MKKLLLPVALLIIWMAPTSAEAMRFWRFNIDIDGKPAFTGGLGMSDRTSPLAALERSLQDGRIQLGKRSSLDKTTAEDVTLSGDVQFHFPELPELQLKRLRVIYAPEKRKTGHHVSGGFYDWRLHPDDAAMIIAHYQGAPKAGNSTAEKRIRWLFMAGPVILVLAAAGCALYLRLRSTYEK